MASPPAKRIRRTVVASSEDEDSAADSQMSSASINATTRTLNLKNQPDSQRQKTSLSKSKSSNKAKSGKKKSSSAKEATVTKNASIYSFFNNATQSSSQKTVKPKSPQLDTNVVDLEDVIEDISSDGEDSKSSIPILQQRTINGKVSDDSPKAANAIERSAISTSKQFSTVPKSTILQQNSATYDGSSSGSWADRYPPESLDELVVHKRKVADVHKWLDNVVKGRERKRLLVLKGPSGSGKTITVKLLAREIGIRLVEWENPVGSSVDDEGFVSLATRFDEFLTRTANFQGLEFANDGNATLNTTQQSSGMAVLIEDFPNIFSRGSLALMNFRENVLRYLVASSPTAGSRTSGPSVVPVVMIVTETHVTSSTNRSDSFTVSKLLGPQILQHFGVTVIEFNPVAPTLLSKAISVVVRKQNRLLSTRWSPNTETVKNISHSGDVRSSINALQLIRLYEQGQLDSANRIQTQAKKTVRKRSLTATDQKPQHINFRDDTIDLFHAAGKVLYNKRKGLEVEQLVQPPPHLRHHFRNRISEVSVDDLYDIIASDVDTFVSTIHENYPLSCHGEDFADNLDDCIAHISDSDLLLSANNAFLLNGQTFDQNPASNFQSDYGFQIASRGLLFSLPYPVERGKTMSAALKLGRDPFKMVYPTVMRLWRIVDDNETLIDDWVDTVQKQDDSSMPCKRLSRTEMVTEYLAYATMINQELAMAPRKEKKSISTLSDVGEDVSTIEAASLPLMSTLALPLPPSPSSTGQATGFVRSTIRFGGQTALPLKEQQLVLSDDDIEDD